MAGPLTGIKITEFTIWQQGPVAGAMLGDLGASIVKIEDREGGDVGRGMAKLIGIMTGVKGRNAYFEVNNRNKRSITLDLRKETGMEILCKLVEQSDVFLTNVRREALDRLGISYQSLSKKNPKLIYAIGSGWGSKGPDANKMSMDFTGVARSGMMTTLGEPEMPPLMLTGGIADQMGAIGLAYAVLGAMVARERTGVGQEVEASLLGSLAMLEGLNLAFYLLTGNESRRFSRQRAGNPLWNYYRCGDGRWLVLACAQGDRFWPSLCTALNIEEIRDDERFRDIDAREQNCVELIKLLDGIFATRSRDEWMPILTTHGLITDRLDSIAEVARDPQMLANDYIVDYDHPAWGQIKTLGFPFTFAKTVPELRMPAPELGQHTEEVLLELGYSWDDIGQLREGQVI